MNKDINAINKILEDLVKSKSIIQVVIVDQNGLPIASRDKDLKKLDSEMENKISALTASVFVLSEKTSNIFDHGNMDQMIIKNQRGKMMITNINDQSLIILILEKDISESILLLKVRQAIKEFSKLEILNRKFENVKEMDFVIPSID
jgi:hypothetical protein